MRKANYDTGDGKDDISYTDFLDLFLLNSILLQKLAHCCWQGCAKTLSIEGRAFRP